MKTRSHYYLRQQSRAFSPNSTDFVVKFPSIRTAHPFNNNPLNSIQLTMGLMCNLIVSYDFLIIINILVMIENISEVFKKEFARPLQLDPLPQLLPRSSNVPHAPKRNPNLTPAEEKLAVKNALRYFPKELHQKLGKEFYEELKEYGHIYMYRFKPTYRFAAYPFHMYPTRCEQAKCIMHNIMNNLDLEVAQFPEELITYGGNGAVFQNWAQYNLTMHYLSILTEQQTLVLTSGHPQGLYPSSQKNPRLVITNGMMVPNYCSKDFFEKLYAMGNTMYGQMTAGSFCYIGSQGIVHGTTLTLLNAARKYLNKNDMKGVVYVTSGLGGMSGAQPKAGDICGCISVTAEVVESALDKRLKQGWVKQKIVDLDKVVDRIREAKKNGEATSIAYLGNIVDLWERLAQEEEHLVDLGSDQTSLHNPYGGGYYPAGMSVEEANKMIVEDAEKFKKCVHETLVRHVQAINKLTAKGMRFWDYGNSFLFMASNAKADILSIDGHHKFRYPSYVEDIMGDIFELGFGPFRWVCSSGSDQDLRKTDKIAEQTIVELMEKCPEEMRMQYDDNLRWIRKAQENKLVVGSKARILYADAIARAMILVRFSEAIEKKELEGPVILSRDHHDVSGADSPYRETASVRDGSMFCADMSVQNFVGTALRGATWVALHNGGGTGWGEVINGGFGVVLTGNQQERDKLKDFMLWDVTNGVGRRSWAGGKNAQFYSKYLMEKNPELIITIPNDASQEDLEFIVKS